MTEENKDFKEWLTLQLFNNNLKIKRFCRELGISRARYYQYMHGGLPSKNTLDRIFKYFNTDISLIETKVLNATRERGWLRGRQRAKNSTPQITP